MKLKKMMILVSSLFLAFLGYFFAGGLRAAAAAGNPDGLVTPFDWKTGQWQIGWPGRVARHDLVYLSPPEDPMQGMALGNGEVGVLGWCEGSKLIFAMNKSDLWDDAPIGRFTNWAGNEEESSTTLRHAGRLIVDFKVPIFDVFYLSDFRGRLRLADATLTILAQGPFGSVTVEAFVSEQDGIFCCEVTNELSEAIPIEVTLERFGSRTFSHWYSQINGDAALGLKGTEASFDAEGMYLTHRLTSGTFAVGTTIRAMEKCQAEYRGEHSYAALAKITGGPGSRFTLLTAVTSPLESAAVAAVQQSLQAIGELTLLKDEQKEAWKAFWLRSLMESGDDYLDNLWHLAMYYAKASQGGKYPGRFINGLWNWSRDFQAWNFYFHWNQQQLYWPLNAAGHPDLIEPYLEYRFRSLPHAQQDAKELFGVEDGAYVSDVCERRGYNSIAEKINHTPVAQIALDFWRQYQYTGDPEFLKTRALPYMLKAARFFETLFVKEEDGLYHAQRGSAYEGWIQLKDSITELACGKALFLATIEACRQAGVEEAELPKWQEMADRLAPWPRVKMDEQMRDPDGKTLRMGVFKGDPAVSEEMLAAGWGIEEKRWLLSCTPLQKPGCADLDDRREIMQKLKLGQSPVTVIKYDWGNYVGIFPWAEFATVFPAGPMGLSDRGTADFLAAVNTAKLYTPSGVGWDPLPVVLARLGLGRELGEVLRVYPDQWQIYVNGWTHWGIIEDIEAVAINRFGKNIVGDVREAEPGNPRAGKRFPMSTWPFRHASLEAMYVLACAMNESLLQSHDGIIRIGPAVRETQKARFTLHAAGGFVVSAEIENGQPVWVSIQSLRGNLCIVENPWPQAFLWREGGEAGMFESKRIEFQTRQDEMFVLIPRKIPINNLGERWQTTPVQYEENRGAKSSPAGLTGLGLERMF